MEGEAWVEVTERFTSDSIIRFDQTSSQFDTTWARFSPRKQDNILPLLVGWFLKSQQISRVQKFLLSDHQLGPGWTVKRDKTVEVRVIRVMANKVGQAYKQ